MEKKKKQRIPRKLKKEAKKLGNIGMEQIRRGSSKGYKMNKRTWKLFHKVNALYHHLLINIFTDVDKRSKNIYFIEPGLKKIDVPDDGLL